MVDTAVNQIGSKNDNRGLLVEMDYAHLTTKNHMYSYNEREGLR